MMAARLHEDAHTQSTDVCACVCSRTFHRHAHRPLNTLFRFPSTARKSHQRGFLSLK